jgi:hypothetical protein
VKKTGVVVLVLRRRLRDLLDVDEEASDDRELAEVEAAKDRDEVNVGRWSDIVIQRGETGASICGGVDEQYEEKLVR